MPLRLMLPLLGFALGVAFHATGSPLPLIAAVGLTVLGVLGWWASHRMLIPIDPAPEDNCVNPYDRES